MSRPGLSMQQLPAIELPMGYFRTAPWFGIAAGVVLLFAGAAPWMSRWTPTTLAATHLLTLGCMVMVMMGALVQVLPVITAASVPGARQTAPWIRTALAFGTVVLAIALAYASPPLFAVAGAALAIAFGLYLVPLVTCLARRIGGGNSIFAIRIAVLCLVTTVALGIFLLVNQSDPTRLAAARAWTNLHVGFGLTGWVAILIMGVSFQVIPMFHVAPDYPGWLARALPVAMLTGLVLQSSWLIGATCIVYAGTTLAILHRRKRRAPDVTVNFWQLASVVLVAGVVCGWVMPAAELLAGVLFLIGFALTVMIGMLYKIVPFLVFTHLQRACLKDPSRIPELPSMHDVIAPERARRQLWLHAMTIATCVAAVLAPELGILAALSLIANFGWLAASIGIGNGRYQETARAWSDRDSESRAARDFVPTPETS